MNDDRALAVLPDKATAVALFNQIAEFQALARSQMKPDLDYGIIPGTGQKPTLLKPGAEKIAKLLGLADVYDILSETENWEKGFFAYKVRCRLLRMGTESVISSGLGECNSMESKYRWRWAWPDDVPAHVDKTRLVSRTVKNGGKQYRLDNDDIYTQVNTLLKMAKKRALVDAALSAGRLSEIFTQDIEDFERPPEKGEEAGKPEAPKLPPCPQCNSALAHRVGTSKTSGKAYDFWGCTNRECKFTAQTWPPPATTPAPKSPSERGTSPEPPPPGRVPLEGTNLPIETDEAREQERIMAEAGNRPAGEQERIMAEAGARPASDPMRREVERLQRMKGHAVGAPAHLTSDAATQLIASLRAMPDRKAGA